MPFLFFILTMCAFDAQNIALAIFFSLCMLGTWALGD